MGYCVNVSDAGHYQMISVSHVQSVPTLKDIASAILDPEAYVQTDGRYVNRKGTFGYFATIKSGDHWYMVSVSDMLQPYHKQWWIDRVG